MAAAIRPATDADSQAVLAAYDWLFAPPGAVPPQWDPATALSRLRVAIESDTAAVLVAVEDGEIVGLCTAYLDLESVRFGLRAWVEDLAVDPDRRSRGIGKALLDAAKEWGRTRGASHLELDSGENRPEAHRFYEREGPSWRSISYGWLL